MRRCAVTEHLANLWERLADRIVDTPALSQGSRVVTWREFDERAARLAGALQAAGLEPGAVVAPYLYNCNEFLEVFFGTLKGRHVPMNVNYRYQDDELTYLLANAEAQALIFHGEFSERVERIKGRLPHLRLLIVVGESEIGGTASSYEDILASHSPAERIWRDPEDITLNYTGGTTGMPKGVVRKVGLTTEGSLGFRSMVTGVAFLDDSDPVEAARQLVDRAERPVVVPASPLMHSTALTFASLPALSAGGEVACLEGHSLDADELFQVVEARRATCIAIVGDAVARPMVQALDERASSDGGYDTSSLKTIVSAGVAWSGEVKAKLLSHIPQVTLADGCGSSEGASYGLQLTREGDPTTTRTFSAAPGLRVLAEDGTEIPYGSGRAGLLASRTSSSEYHKDPEKSATAFFRIDGEQYVVPGDWGMVAADGTVTLLGRGSMTINTGGEKVFPEEVEQVINVLPFVRDSLVFGTPHQRFGQQVTAIVQLEKGAVPHADIVIEGVRARLAHYKAPQEVVFVALIPRGANGKPDYERARELYDEFSAEEPTSRV
jgi:fatty-acyl-CoA synthase